MHAFAITGVSAVALMGMIQPCPAPHVFAGVGTLIAASTIGTAKVGVSTTLISAASAVGTSKIGGVVLNGAVSGAISGPIGASFGKLKARQSLAPGVSDAELQICTDQVLEQEGSVHFTDLNEEVILIENLPPACMTLVTVLTETSAQEGGPFPVPIGSDSVEYRGLTWDQRGEVIEAFSALQ